MRIYTVCADLLVVQQIYCVLNIMFIVLHIEPTFPRSCNEIYVKKPISSTVYVIFVLPFYRYMA